MIRSLINQNALFVINDSGGKDSQAMKIRLMNALRHLCQRCHLRHDLGNHIMNRKYGREHKRKGQMKLFGLANTS